MCYTNTKKDLLFSLFMNFSQPLFKNTALVLGIFLLGVALGFGAGTGFSKPQSKIAATPPNTLPTQKIPSAQSSSTPQQEGSRQDRGLFGVVIKKDKTLLTVQEILNTNVMGSTIYLVRVDASTIYSHQKPAEGGKFTVEKGSLDAIKQNVFVYFSTKNTLVSTPGIQATQIIYSEQSPFRKAQ